MTFGHAQSAPAMKLNASRIWAPINAPQYLLILQPGMQIPKTRAQFLTANAQMIQRLKEEAGEEEVEEANQILARLEPEVLDWLPADLLANPKTPEQLTDLQAVEGSPLHEWKVGVDEALKALQMPEAEAREIAEALTLPSRISQMIEV